MQKAVPFGTALEKPELVSHRVELNSKSALLVCCVVLVNEILDSSLVDRFNSNFIGADGCFLVTLVDCVIKVLDSGLESGLLSLVSHVTNLGDLVSLCRRLNVGHFLFATSSYKVSGQIRL